MIIEILDKVVRILSVYFHIIQFNINWITLQVTIKATQKDSRGSYLDLIILPWLSFMFVVNAQEKLYDIRRMDMGVGERLQKWSHPYSISAQFNSISIPITPVKEEV